MVDAILAWGAGVPRILVYLGLGGGAALENVVPAVPADTFVLLGGLLSATGGLLARWVFLATWVGNVTSALVMYQVGRTHGRVFFDVGWGRHLLNTHQVERMRRFYQRWGVLAVFFVRFLPGLRAVVPVFAGVAHERFARVALPIGLASAAWYGALVWLGTVAGHNLDKVFALLDNANHVLLALAVAVGAAIGVWWWKTRHHG